MNFLSVLYAKAGITVDGVTTLNNTATGQTPATNDNSTKLATTAFVKNQNYYPYPTGTTSQYVRGDGSLATFSQGGGGGGSSVNYYLNGSVSQGTIGGNTYYEMSKTAIIGTNADFSINADGYVAQFVTDAGDPALLNIPGGNWNFEMFFSASSGGGTPSFYVELYKYDGTTLTLIASGTAESITGGTATDLYITALAVPTTTLTLTDRLAVRVYVNHSGRTITLHTQNGHLCQVITTFTTGLTALNGLTAQVQNFAVGAGGTDFNISSVIDTHTFNLPTASATKRGALSSIDWSAFDAKVDFGDLSATSPLNYNGSGVFSIAQSSTSTNGYLSSTDWNTFNNKQDALTNPVTGIGTTNFISKWSGTNTLTDSLFFSDADVAKTIHSGADAGLYLDFANNQYKFGVININGIKVGISNTEIGDYDFDDTGTILSVDRGTEIIKTSSQGIDKGLYLDFVNNTYLLGNEGAGWGNMRSFNNTVTIGDTAYNNFGTKFIVDDTNQVIKTQNPNDKGLYIDYPNNIYALGFTDGGLPFTDPVDGFVYTSDYTTIGSRWNWGEYIEIKHNEQRIYLETNRLHYRNLTTTEINALTGNQEGDVTYNNTTHLLNFYNGTAWQGVGTITGTGTTNYLPKFTGASALGNSLLQETSNAIGLNVTPKAWGNNNKVLETTFSTSLIGRSDFSALGRNFFYNSGDDPIYSNNGFASGYFQADGEHLWVSAASGTAGNTISFAQTMTLKANGNLGIGTTSPLSILETKEANRTNGSNITNVGIYSTSAQDTGVGGTIGFGGLFTGSDYAPFGSIRGGKENNTSGNYAGYLAFQTIQNGGSLVERGRFASGGNFLIGTTTDAGYKLDVNGTARVQGAVQTRNLQIAGASGGYTTGDNPMIGLGSFPVTNTFGTIEAPFGDKMKFNAYHGFEFKTSNNGASPVLMFSIGVTGAATFSSTLSTGGNATFGLGANRPVTYDTSGGNFRITPTAGGWATGYFFNGNAGTFRGGFGAYGGSDALIYYWIGTDYNTATLYVDPVNNRVGINNSSPAYTLDVAGTTRVSSNSNSYIVSPHAAGIDIYSTGNIAPHYQTTYTWYTGLIGAGVFRMGLDASGNLTAGSFIGAGTGLTGTASGLSIGGSAATAGTSTYASILSTTNQGIVGSTGLTTVSSEAQWSNFPIGYSAMFLSNQTATGAPSGAYGFFIKIANRDAGGGWGGIWTDYSGGDTYVGNTTTSSTYANWYKLLSSNNFNSYAPTLTGTGASGTWGISISGNAATATNISNTGTVTLATATESNSIYITQPSYTTDQPVKLLNFDWYGNVWQMGNIRSGATASNGFGIYLSGTEKVRIGNDGRISNLAWSTSGRNYSNEWIEFPNNSGLYSPINSAHFFPNNGSYGSWKITGTRNGYAGLEFGALTNGSVALIIQPNSNETGFYNTAYGWQFLWNNGELQVSKNTYGGGYLYTVLDSANYTAYLAGYLPLTGGTITGDLTVNNRVYVGTGGCYLEQVLIGGVYELQVVDSAGNRTVLS